MISYSIYSTTFLFSLFLKWFSVEWEKELSRSVLFGIVFACLVSFWIIVFLRPNWKTSSLEFFSSKRWYRSLRLFVMLSLTKLELVPNLELRKQPGSAVLNHHTEGNGLKSVKFSYFFKKNCFLRSRKNWQRYYPSCIEDLQFMSRSDIRLSAML